MTEAQILRHADSTPSPPPANWAKPPHGRMNYLVGTAISTTFPRRQRPHLFGRLLHAFKQSFIRGPNKTVQSSPTVTPTPIAPSSIPLNLSLPYAKNATSSLQLVVNVNPMLLQIHSHWVLVSPETGKSRRLRPGGPPAPGPESPTHSTLPQVMLTSSHSVQVLVVVVTVLPSAVVTVVTM